jgi:hypothetical protein
MRPVHNVSKSLDMIVPHSKHPELALGYPVSSSCMADLSLDDIFEGGYLLYSKEMVLRIAE